MTSKCYTNKGGDFKKYAIEIEETLSKTIIVEADSEQEALSLVEDAYDSEAIVLDADNSNFTREFRNATNTYHPKDLAAAEIDLYSGGTDV